MEARVSATSRRIPALERDRQPLIRRGLYDFSDYGFSVSISLAGPFEVVPMEVSEEAAFLFLYPRKDLETGRFSLFNFHIFLKYIGSLEEFAHSRGASVKNIALEDTRVLGVPAKIYRRTISMAALFEGVPQVIDLIGGRPDLVVVDSHVYFEHRHAHAYSGMLHEPGNDQAYEQLRTTLFAGIRLVH